MEIGRRELLTGLTAVAAAGVVPRPIRATSLIPRLEPILPTIDRKAHRLMSPILKTATWQYQHIGGFARQGIIRHLASGFTFWTYTAPDEPWQLGDYWIAVQPLFREGDELPADLAAHHAIALAATHAGTIATDLDETGCIYLPPWRGFDDDSPPYYPAPPIVAQDFTLS